MFVEPNNERKKLEFDFESKAARVYVIEGTSLFYIACSLVFIWNRLGILTQGIKRFKRPMNVICNSNS